MDYTLTETKNIAIEYPLPTKGKRLLVNFIDVICLIVTTIALYFASYAATTKTPVFTQAQAQMLSMKTDDRVAIYDKDGNSIIDQNIESIDARVKSYESALFKFYSADNTLVFPYKDGKPNNEGLDYYNNVRKAVKIGDDNMFDPDNNYEKVPTVYNANPKAYISFYESLINEAAGLLVQTDAYMASSLVVFWSVVITFLIAYVLAFMLLFLVLPLCFHRGYKTLGMLVGRFGLVYVDGLIPTNGRFLLRFTYMFILEGLLSFVTLGIPFIFSGIMAYGSKNGESLHDYLVNTYLVDVTNSQLFYTPGEYGVYVKQRQEKGLPLAIGGSTPEQTENQKSRSQ